jgi:hypothetical protein
MLDGRVPKFRGANPKHREKIVREAADHIKSTWTEDVEFHRGAVINVRELSV